MTDKQNDNYEVPIKNDFNCIKGIDGPKGCAVDSNLAEATISIGLLSVVVAVIAGVFYLIKRKKEQQKTKQLLGESDDKKDVCGSN